MNYNSINKDDQLFVANDIMLYFKEGVSNDNREMIHKYLSSASWLSLRNTKSSDDYLIIENMPDVGRLHFGMDSHEVFMSLGKATEVPAMDMMFLINGEKPLRNMEEYPWGLDGRSSVVSLQLGYTRTMCMWNLAVLDKDSGKHYIVLDVDVVFEFSDITKIDAFSNPYIKLRDDGWKVYWYYYKCQLVDIEDVAFINGLEKLSRGPPIPLNTEH